MDEEQILEIIRENIDLAQKGRYRSRDAYRKAKGLFSAKHIISIVGVRRCGKSTLMKELVRDALKKAPKTNILYLNLEHPFFNQYKDDVANLKKIYDIFRSHAVKARKIFIFFDEVQFFKDWQVLIKHIYEKDEAKIILTGSNSRLLSSELSTLLSGRTIPVRMFPFSCKEADVGIDEYMTDGGFPEVVLKKGPKEMLAETYYKNILYQDVIPRFGIKNSLAIENLSYYLISNIAKELSYNTLKSISHLDDKTIKQYMLHLQDANLIYVLNNYDFSLKKLIGNKKKVYVVDPLFTQLAFRHSPDKGRLFENLVYMHLKRAGKDIYFHKNGGECDFLVKEGVKIVKAIQVCYRLDEENRAREVQGLLSAMEKFGLKDGTIVTYGQNEDLEDKGISVIDIRTFLRKFGMNSEK